ncbi:hypothetical protein WDW37_06440 [Bdellovibrionota bacterium FG-1]
MKSLYLYQPDAYGKGLIGVISNDRIEARAHHLALKEELEFNIKALSLDEDKALQMIDSEIKHLLSDYVVDKIAELKVSYLVDFVPLMNHEQLRRIEPKLELLDYLSKLSSGKVPKDFWTRAPELMTNSDSSVGEKISYFLKNQNSWPNEFWDHIQKLLMHPNPSFQKIACLALQGNAPWPEEIWRQVHALLKSPNQNLRKNLIVAMRGQSQLPDFIWNELPNVMTSKPEVQEALLVLLKKHAQWPEPVWEILPTLISKADRWVLHSIFTALQTQSHGSEDFRAKFLSLMAKLPEKTRDKIPENLRLQLLQHHGGCLSQVNALLPPLR